MPSLGGLLKKRRTKDSQTLSKELEAGSSPTAAQTQTSPIDGHHQNHHQNHHHAATNSSNAAASTVSSSQNPPAATHHHHHSSASNKSANPQPASMQSAVPQSTPSHPAPGHALPSHQSNAASIQNIIHSSQQQGAHAGSGSNANSQQTSARSDARTTKGKYSLEDFTLQRTLGTGSFGRVHLVQSKHNHRFYAIKVLKKAQVVKMKQIEHTNDERRMLNRVRHPFLVTLWGTWQDARNLYMVMDFVEGGELFSLLRKSQVSLSPDHLRWAPRGNN